MSSEVQPPILVERRGAVAVVTLNRPSKLNALSSQLVEELGAAIQELDAADQVGAIVLTGAGERAFSSGGDMAEQRAEIAAGTISRRRSASKAIQGCSKPIIAAIRGYCYGGGALLAVNCDIRIAGTDARFKFHGASYGQAPGGAVLPRIVGEAKAKELLFTGDNVEAQEALRIGLVNQLVAPEEVLETAVAMAGRIAANSRPAVAILKQTIEKALPIDQALAHEQENNLRVRVSQDSAERFRTAAEKVVGPA
jgi:enoyl-CoA hydratase